MILYNVTVGIEKSIEREWIDWMKTVYIPAMLELDCFTHYEFYKVLSHQDGAVISYCIQYHCPNITAFNRYLKDHAPALTQRLQIKFKDRHTAFHTLLEKI